MDKYRKVEKVRELKMTTRMLFKVKKSYKNSEDDNAIGTNPSSPE